MTDTDELRTPISTGRPPRRRITEADADADTGSDTGGGSSGTTPHPAARNRGPTRDREEMDTDWYRTLLVASVALIGVSLAVLAVVAVWLALQLPEILALMRDAIAAIEELTVALGEAGVSLDE